MLLFTSSQSSCPIYKGLGKKRLLNYGMFGIPVLTFANLCWSAAAYCFCDTDFNNPLITFLTLIHATSLLCLLLVFRLNDSEDADMFHNSFLKPAAPPANSKSIFTSGVTLLFFFFCHIVFIFIPISCE